MDVDRESPALGGDQRRIAQQPCDRLAIERRRHDEQSQVLAQGILDIEAKRQTEIEVINGAIVEAGRRSNVPTPYNDAMVWLVGALQAKYLAAQAAGGPGRVA